MVFINYLNRITRISPILNDKEKSLIDTLKVLIANKGDFFEQWLKTIFEFTASDFAILFAVQKQAKGENSVNVLSRRGLGADIPETISPELTDLLIFAAEGDQPITCNNKEDMHFTQILLSRPIKSGIVIPLSKNKKGEHIVALFNSKYTHWYEKEVFAYLQQVREVSLTILNNR